MQKPYIFWHIFSSAAVSMLLAWIVYTPGQSLSFEVLFLASFLGMVIMDGLLWGVSVWRKRRISPLER